MSDIRLVGAVFEHHSPPSTDCISETLSKIVDSELQATFKNNAYPNPTDIELMPLEGEDMTLFLVKSQHQTASEETPGTFQRNGFLLQLISDPDNKTPLEGHYLRRMDGSTEGLGRPEALFFLGLSFRTAAFYRLKNKI